MMMKVKMIFSAKAAQHEHDLGGSQKGTYFDGSQGVFLGGY